MMLNTIRGYLNKSYYQYAFSGKEVFLLYNATSSAVVEHLFIVVETDK